MRCVCSRQMVHALLASVLQPLDKVAAPPRASLLSRTNRGSTTLPATRGSTALLPSPSHASAWAVGPPLRRRHLGLSGHLGNHARGRPLPQPHGQLHHKPPDHEASVPQRRREPDGCGQSWKSRRREHLDMCPRCGPRCSRPWARSGPTKTWKRRPRRRRRARRPTILIDRPGGPAPIPPFRMMCASRRPTSSRPKHCSRGRRGGSCGGR